MYKSCSFGHLPFLSHRFLIQNFGIVIPTSPDCSEEIIIITATKTAAAVNIVSILLTTNCPNSLKEHYGISYSLKLQLLVRYIIFPVECEQSFLTPMSTFLPALYSNWKPSCCRSFGGKQNLSNWMVSHSQLTPTTDVFSFIHCSTSSL